MSMASLSIAGAGALVALLIGASDSSPSASLDGTVVGLKLLSVFDCFLPRGTLPFRTVAEAAGFAGDGDLASLGLGKKNVGFFNHSSPLNVPVPLACSVNGTPP
jgi:hypothetical protein